MSSNHWDWWQVVGGSSDIRKKFVDVSSHGYNPDHIVGGLLDVRFLHIWWVLIVLVLDIGHSVCGVIVVSRWIGVLILLNHPLGRVFRSR